MTALPSATTVLGLATRLDSALLGALAPKVTLVFAAATPAWAVTCFTSATVEAKVVVRMPFASVRPCTSLKKLRLPVLENVTNSAATGCPALSRKVSVNSVVVPPSAATWLGFATKKDATLLGTPRPGAASAKVTVTASCRGRDWSSA